MAFQKTLHHLRSRPHHERDAVARTGAFVVTGVLFVGWAVYFFATIQTSNITQVPSNLSNDAQTAAVVSAAQSQFHQLSASTTESLQQISVAAELQAQRAQDAAQSATGTVATTTSESNNEDAIPDATVTPTYRQ